MGVNFWRIVGGAVLAGSLTGCSSAPVFEFDGLDLARTSDVLTEFSLGEYKIPIPLAEESGENQLVHRHRLELDFSLYALVSPSEIAQLTDVWGRHEGKIRDQVIRVCRNATLDELQEPELLTLKARLIDALAGPMGGRPVRQLLVSEVVSQEI